MVHLGRLDIAKSAAKAWGADLFGYNRLAVGIALALAVVLYVLIERPALLLKRRLPPGTAGPWPIVATVGAVSTGLVIIFWHAVSSRCHRYRCYLGVLTPQPTGLITGYVGR